MAGVIARATGNALLGNVTFSDWADLFRAVAAYQPDQKKVIVLDEFPYMVKTNPAFPSILQNIWDEFLQDSNIMLILIGLSCFVRSLHISRNPLRDLCCIFLI